MMTMLIANAPCSWGVDDPKNPNLPPWQKVLDEAATAGYPAIELGPWGYLPTEVKPLSTALEQAGLALVAGTIFDDLVSEHNFPRILELTHSICRNLSLAPVARQPDGENPPPYLVIIDFGDPRRAQFAGQSERAPRLASADWQRMVEHITTISHIAWKEYRVRPVIHPHAGGCIEFADEITQLAGDIPHQTAGFCLDTGHLYYSGMDPVAWLDRYFSRLDYLHFKDVNAERHREQLTLGADFFSACAAGVMCPLGQGAIDYPAIRDLLVERRYRGWITLEHERDPRDAHSSLHDVTESLRYLRGIGF
jgi:inosose dehydratase